MALIKIKRGPSSNITSLNLEAGEPAFTTDTRKLYVGDAEGGKVLINPEITIDDVLSTTSANAIQNKVVKKELDLKAPLKSPAFTDTPTAPTAVAGTSTAQIATTAFVKAAVDALLGASDAMMFKGTLGTGGTVSALPASHKCGDTYKVVANGTYAGQVCNVGDLIMCITTGTTANDAHWTAVEANMDGVVTGPASSTDNAVAVFDSTSGKVIKSSGLTIGTSVPADAKFTDTVYTHPAHTGEVTGSTALTITAKAVTNAKMADMGANTIKGAVSAGSPNDLTPVQVADMISKTTITAKATPVDADSIVITDSAASNVAKRTTWTQIKTFLKTYFGTLYARTPADITATSANTTMADATTTHTHALAANSVTNAKLAKMATANTLKGTLAANADPADLTVAQVKGMLGCLDADSVIDGGSF